MRNGLVVAVGGCSLGMDLTHFKEATVSVDEWEGRSGLRRRYPVNTSSGHSHKEELEVLDVRSRKKLLREAAVEKISVEEGIECEAIRSSRRQCGCDCESCQPESCSCTLNGMACHSEGETLGPCACGKENCRNPEGRTEFDAETIDKARETVLQRERETELIKSSDV